MDEGSSASNCSSPPVHNSILKEFIETYQTCTSLWDRKNQNYLNKMQRMKDLDKLLKIYKHMKPNATREDVRKKINSLRSNYRKELKKIEHSKWSSKGGEIYKPTSMTFHLLQFLGKIQKPVLIKEDSDEVSEEGDPLVCSYLEDEDPPRKYQKTMRGSIPKQNEVTSPSYTLLSQPTEPSQAVHPLALVWSEKINNLTTTQRLYAEKAINDILFEAELNSLNGGSIKPKCHCQRRQQLSNSRRHHLLSKYDEDNSNSTE